EGTNDIACRVDEEPCLVVDAAGRVVAGIAYDSSDVGCDRVEDLPQVVGPLLDVSRTHPDAYEARRADFGEGVEQVRVVELDASRVGAAGGVRPAGRADARILDAIRSSVVGSL